MKSTLSNFLTFPFTRRLYNFKKSKKCQKYFYQLGSLFLQELFHIQDSTRSWLLWNKRWIWQINQHCLTAFSLFATVWGPSIFGDVSKQTLHQKYGFNKRLTTLLSPSGLHVANFSTEQKQTQFLFKTTLSRRLYTNSGWKLIPQSQQDSQCWSIWARFPWDLGISLADCCCHISSLFRQHPQLHCGCWTTSVKHFPLIPAWFCPAPEIIGLPMAKPTRQTWRERRTLFSDMCIGTRTWEKPCEEELPPWWDLHPQAARAVPRHSCVHESILRAALPSDCQHFALVKPKGSQHHPKLSCLFEDPKWARAAWKLHPSSAAQWETMIWASKVAIWGNMAWY